MRNNSKSNKKDPKSDLDQYQKIIDQVGGPKKMQRIALWVILVIGVLGSIYFYFNPRQSNTKEFADIINQEELNDEIQAHIDSVQDASGMRTVAIDTISINAKCNSKALGDSISELKARLEKLEQLDNHYQTIKIAATSFDESIFCEGILKLYSFNLKSPQLDIQNIDDFEQSILGINQAFVKGTKDLGKRLYARAQVEEIIFKSEVCAAEWASFAKQIKATTSLWEDVDKSPSSIFNDGNKVYYISTGGWYMKPFYEEIAEAMLKDF